jgi:hypothetical protein
VPLQVHRDFRCGLPHWSGLDLDRALAGFLRKAPLGFLRNAWDCFRRGCRSIASAPESKTHHGNQKPQLFATLSLTSFVVPAAVKLPERGLGWLAMFAGTVGLAIVLRGRFSGIPWVVKKVVRLGISVCLLYGFWMLMNWKLLWVVLGPLGLTRREMGFWLMLGAILIWWVSVLWIVFSRPGRQQGGVADNPAQSVVHQDVSATTDEVHSDTLHPAASKPPAFQEGRNAGSHRIASGRPRRNRRGTDRTIDRYLN